MCAAQLTCEIQDRCEPGPIGILRPTCFHAHRIAHARALARIVQQPRNLLGSLPCISEVQDRLALRAKNFAVLFCVFRKHTAPYSSDLKAAHDMAVTVRSPHKTEIHLSSSCQRTKLPRRLEAQRIRPRFGE